MPSSHCQEYCWQDAIRSTTLLRTPLWEGLFLGVEGRRERRKRTRFSHGPQEGKTKIITIQYRIRPGQMNQAHIWCSINVYRISEWLNGKEISVLEAQKRWGLLPGWERLVAGIWIWPWIVSRVFSVITWSTFQVREECEERVGTKKCARSWESG